MAIWAGQNGKKTHTFPVKRLIHVHYILDWFMHVFDGKKHIYIYGTPPPQKPTFSHFVPVFTVVFAFLKTFFFFGIFLLVLEVVFINVYKHRGCLDPRSKILGKTSWIQGLDPRSKISRKNFLDPRSGSKIQDPRFWEKLLGSKVWIQDPRSKILGKTSWIQGLDPRSKIPGKTSWIHSGT